jgi:hypothetical protein
MPSEVEQCHYPIISNICFCIKQNVSTHVMLKLVCKEYFLTQLQWSAKTNKHMGSTTKGSKTEQGDVYKFFLFIRCSFTAIHTSIILPTYQYHFANLHIMYRYIYCQCLCNDTANIHTYNHLRITSRVPI